MFIFYDKHVIIPVFIPLILFRFDIQINDYHMKKTIHFNYGSGMVSIFAEENIILPRIGETINMSYIISDEEKMKEFYEEYGSYSITISDIFHEIDFQNNEQHIEISLSDNFYEPNAFYMEMAN